MQGICNTGSNITFYALSSNIIGWFLDWGGCTATDLPPVQPEVFWSHADGECQIVDAGWVKPSPHWVGAPSDNMTCIVTPAAADQDCVLQHKLVEQSVMDAVEDPARCEETWRQAFLGMSFCCFAAVLVFKVWGSARDITQKIDDEIAARRGGAATVESLGHVAALSGAMGGSAAPGFEHSNPLGEITAL